MKVTKEKLLTGNSTKIKNKVYSSTKDYVQPFIDYMQRFTSEFVCNVKPAEQISINKEENLIFNKVLISAIMPESYWSYNGWCESISLVYGLDSRKPVYKIIRSIYNPKTEQHLLTSLEMMRVFELNPGESFDIDCIKDLLEYTSDFETALSKLSSSFVDTDNIFSLIGEWVDFCVTKSYNSELYKVCLQSTLPVDIYKDIYLNDESDYHIPSHEEPNKLHFIEMFNSTIYNEKDKDLLNRFEKSYLIKTMIDNEDKCNL